MTDQFDLLESIIKEIFSLGKTAKLTALDKNRNTKKYSSHNENIFVENKSEKNIFQENLLTKDEIGDFIAKTIKFFNEGCRLINLENQLISSLFKKPSEQSSLSLFESDQYYSFKIYLLFHLYFETSNVFDILKKLHSSNNSNPDSPTNAGALHAIYEKKYQAVAHVFRKHVILIQHHPKMLAKIDLCFACLFRINLLLYGKYRNISDIYRANKYYDKINKTPSDHLFYATAVNDLLINGFAIADYMRDDSPLFQMLINWIKSFSTLIPNKLSLSDLAQILGSIDETALYHICQAPIQMQIFLQEIITIYRLPEKLEKIDYSNLLEIYLIASKRMLPENAYASMRSLLTYMFNQDTEISLKLKYSTLNPVKTKNFDHAFELIHEIFDHCSKTTDKEKKESTIWLLENFFEFLWKHLPLEDFPKNSQIKRFLQDAPGFIETAKSKTCSFIEELKINFNSRTPKL